MLPTLVSLSVDGKRDHDEMTRDEVNRLLAESERRLAEAKELESKYTKRLLEERILSIPCRDLRAIERLPKDWLTNAPHGKWFPICNSEIASLQMYPVTLPNYPFGAYPVKKFYFSSVLAEHGLVMMYSQLPGNWPFAWYLDNGKKYDFNPFYMVSIVKMSEMNTLEKNFPGVNAGSV